MAGFSYRYRVSGAAPTVQAILPNAEEQFTTGDVVTEAAGVIKVAGTGGTKYVGIVQETKKPKTTQPVEVITDYDAVYGVEDNNARKIGDTLDLAGTTGAQGVAASSNKEFVVVATKKSATEETLVRFNYGKHLYNTAQ